MKATAYSNQRRRPALMAALCAALLAAPMAHAADGEGDPGKWDWVVAPYLWGVGFDTSVQRTQPPVGGISGDSRFDDVLEKFDGVFQVHAEGQGDEWGVFTDFTYLGLADEAEHPRFHTQTDLDARLFEAAVVWSPGEARYQGLDVFGGLRYIDADLTILFDPINPAFQSTTFDGSRSYNDLMLGARYTWPLSDRWGVTLRGDASFGDTEGTWNASAVANYKTSNGAWVFGYRYLSVELETGGTYTDMTLSGLMVGYAFKF